MERIVKFTEQYAEFFEKLNVRAKLKVLKGLDLLRELPVISPKLAKKLTNTEFYELRISVDNEIRVIFFCIDNDNLNQAKEVILLNGFIKKDTKDYKKHIARAITILNNFK